MSALPLLHAVREESSSLVLDSYALLAYFEEEKGANVVENTLLTAASGKLHLTMSAVNWGEVYYSIFRTKGEKAAELCLSLIKQMPITIVLPDIKLTKSAAKIKAQHALAYADCFAASLAQMRDCPVLTGDKEFKKLEKQLKIHWI